MSQTHQRSLGEHVSIISGTIGNNSGNNSNSKWFVTQYGAQPPVQPRGPQVGDIAHKSNALFVWNGEQWVNITPGQHVDQYGVITVEPPAQSAPLEAEADFDFTDICSSCEGADLSVDRFCLFHRGWVQGRLSR